MIFASTLPINDDPLPWKWVGNNNGVFSGRAGAPVPDDCAHAYHSVFSPRPEYDRPRAHEANRILLELRVHKRDIYSLLQDLESRWAMHFTEAEVEHAYRVLERLAEMRRSTRFKEI